MKEIVAVSLIALVESKMRGLKDFYHSTRMADHPLEPNKPTPPSLETPRINPTSHNRSINQRHTSGRRRF